VKVTLALDLGTNLGFALLRADGRIESGIERFEAKSKEGPGMRWVHFKRWLVDMKACNEGSATSPTSSWSAACPARSTPPRCTAASWPRCRRSASTTSSRTKACTWARSRSAGPATARRRSPT
jgi:hypothetical protein